MYFHSLPQQESNNWNDPNFRMTITNGNRFSFLLYIYIYNKIQFFIDGWKQEVQRSYLPPKGENIL